jgi:hypothetical protein
MLPADIQHCAARVFIDLPSPSELFSDASDDGRITEPLGLLEGAPSADDAEAAVAGRRGAVAHDEGIKHTPSKPTAPKQFCQSIVIGICRTAALV